MVFASDPVANELRRQWLSLLDDSRSIAFVRHWAMQQLSFQTWADEPTHDGLQELVHIHKSAEASRFAKYCDWIEVVHWFEDDPVQWNKWYHLRFASKLVRGARDFRLRTLDMMIESGALLADDPDVVRFRASLVE